MDNLKKATMEKLMSLKKTLFLSFFSFLVFVPFFASADCDPSSLTFCNPLTSIETLPDFIDALLTIVIKIAIPVIVIFIIIAGFQFVTARGDTEKLKTARASFVAVVIGAAIILGAKILVSAITGTIGELGV